MESVVDPVKWVQRVCEVKRVFQAFKVFPERQVSMEL
jgi:hypothetical protein